MPALGSYCPQLVVFAVDAIAVAVIVVIVVWHTCMHMRVFIFIYVSTTTSKKEEKGRKRKKDEEREVPDPWESIEDTPAVNFHLFSSNSDFREPSFEQQSSTCPYTGTELEGIRKSSSKAAQSIRSASFDIQVEAQHARS